MSFDYRTLTDPEAMAAARARAVAEITPWLTGGPLSGVDAGRLKALTDQHRRLLDGGTLAAAERAVASATQEAAQVRRDDYGRFAGGAVSA